MGALEAFLARRQFNFDPAEILNAEVYEWDFAVPPPSLYKYFSASRSEFFTSPKIRFTQRSSLNDPFELSARWQKIAPDAFGAIMACELKSKLSELLSNKGLVLQILKEEFAKRGTFLAPDQMAEASAVLLSMAGDRQYQQLIRNAVDAVESQVELMLCALNFVGRDTIEEEVSTAGIFSMSENPTSEQMWGLYSGSGTGFVVEFDAHHDFFKAPNGRTLVRPVSYTDEHAESLIQSPLHAFSVKHKK